MRPPPLLVALSLAANAALLGVLVARPMLAPPALRNFFRGGPSAEAIAAEARAQASSQARAKADAVRATTAADDPASLWAALAAEDIRELIARLRAAGFPVRVIRSIVNARLNAQLKDRFLAKVGPDADLPYWKSDSTTNPFFGGKLWEVYSELSRDRSRQYRELMREDFFASAGDLTPSQKRNFGNLPRSKIDQIERINADYAEMSSQIRTAGQGVTLSDDREKLAMLEREKRADLAALLSPEELADYEMRTSLPISRYRSAFTYMDATEQEVQAVYRLQKAYDDRSRAAVNSNNPAALNLYDSPAAESLQRQLQDEIKAALGDQRYAEFQRAQNGEFQTLYSYVQREGLPIEVATRVFALRDSTTQESSRIMSDPARTLEQKQEAIKALAQATRAQMLSSLGSTAGPAYIETATRWLSPLERGQAVTFNARGVMTVQKNPPAAAQAPAR